MSERVPIARVSIDPLRTVQRGRTRYRVTVECDCTRWEEHDAMSPDPPSRWCAGVMRQNIARRMRRGLRGNLAMSDVSLTCPACRPTLVYVDQHDQLLRTNAASTGYWYTRQIGACGPRRRKKRQRGRVGALDGTALSSGVHLCVIGAQPKCDTPTITRLPDSGMMLR
jgi:hypothetical protein